jgi:uncharacterized protein YceK
MLSRDIKKIFLLAVMVSFSGCATSAKYVSPTYVSPVQYQHYHCDQIEQELTRCSRTVEQVADQQSRAASKDAWAMGVGMAVSW